MTTRVEKATFWHPEGTRGAQTASGLGAASDWPSALLWGANVRQLTHNSGQFSSNKSGKIKAVEVQMPLNQVKYTHTRTHVQALHPFSNISWHLFETHSYLHRRGRRRRTRLDRRTDSGQDAGRPSGPCRRRSDLDSPHRTGSLHGTGLGTHTFPHWI